MKKRLTAYVWLLLLLAFYKGSLQAQFSSSIEGTVTDLSGAIVPNAGVVVTGMTTGVSISSKTNGSGFYKFPSLGPGSYKVTVSSTGFGDQTVENVVLTAEQTRGISFKLQPKSESVTVDVSASQVSVDTDEAKIGSVVTQKLVEELPLQGRDAFNVANQAPGVHGDRFDGYSRAKSGYLSRYYYTSSGCQWRTEP